MIEYSVFFLFFIFVFCFWYNAIQFIIGESDTDKREEDEKKKIIRKSINSRIYYIFR